MSLYFSDTNYPNEILTSLNSKGGVVLMRITQKNDILCDSLKFYQKFRGKLWGTNFGCFLLFYIENKYNIKHIVHYKQ